LSWTKTKILNPSRSDFKYPSDFGFLKNCRIPSDSDADSESVTSLEQWYWTVVTKGVSWIDAIHCDVCQNWSNIVI